MDEKRTSDMEGNKEPSQSPQQPQGSDGDQDKRGGDTYRPGQGGIGGGGYQPGQSEMPGGITSRPDQGSLRGTDASES